jgi:hypothetical protein
MVTNRTPINRPPTTRVTPEAVEIFRKMREARDGSDQWWELHAKLHTKLKLKPWQWPAIEHPDNKCVYPGDGGAGGGARWFPQAQALYRELAARVAQ